MIQNLIIKIPEKGTWKTFFFLRVAWLGREKKIHYSLHMILSRNEFYHGPYFKTLMIMCQICLKSDGFVFLYF